MEGSSYLGLKRECRLDPADAAMRLRAMMAADWPRLRDFPRVDPAEARAWQWERVKGLVDYAFRHVPLYRRKYAAAGFAPGDLRGWDDFHALPVLRKEELIAAFPDGLVKDRADLRLTVRSTGTSGQFVTIGVSEEAILADTLRGVRQFHTQSGGDYRPEDLALFIYGSPWWVDSVAGRYRQAYIPTSTPVEEAIEAIRRARPKVLSLYPSYLKRIAERCDDLADSGVRLIVTNSEQSGRRERVGLSRHFGVPVLDEYSSEELTRIALECPHRRYHLEEDSCYIEFRDPETGAPSQPGMPGLVVGTNLLNMATPILRYVQGDLASPEAESPCPCGNRFRTMGLPQGRVLDSIVTPAGDRVPASLILERAYDWFWEFDVPVQGLKYQVVQAEDGDVCVHLVPGVGEVPADRIVESLYKVLPRDMRVTARVASALPYPGVKTRPVVSLARGASPVLAAAL